MVVRVLLQLVLALAALSGEGWLPRYDLSARSARSQRLPRSLAEVSGLAVDGSGRFFTHQDESSTVYQLDPEDGSVLKRFYAGSKGRAGDFEGIAVVGARFFLLTSDGVLLEFREAADGEVAPAREIQTGLGARCELEGLAWDRTRASLLLPCKAPHARELEGRLVIFSVPLATLRPEPEPRVQISLSELETVGLKGRFHPSSLEVHPSSGSLFLVAAQEEALLELSPEGRPLSGRRLPARLHLQTEGMAFAPDLSLWLVDEGRGRGGLLTRHALLPEGPAPSETSASAGTAARSRALVSRASQGGGR